MSPEEIKVYMAKLLGQLFPTRKILSKFSESNGNLLFNNQEIGSGSSGHTIQDSSDTSMTARSNLKFGGDFDVTDDSENDKTEVKVHELTSEEWDEVFEDLPNAVNGNNNGNNNGNSSEIIIDESGTEYVVGKYIYSNGTSKPIYQRNIVQTILRSQTSSNKYNVNIASWSIDKVLYYNGTLHQSNNHWAAMPYCSTLYNGDCVHSWIEIENNLLVIQLGAGSWLDEITTCFTVQYTKTTDTATSALE